LIIVGGTRQPQVIGIFFYSDKQSKDEIGLLLTGYKPEKDNRPTIEIINNTDSRDIIGIISQSQRMGPQLTQ
jgi:hypothetical protein